MFSVFSDIYSVQTSTSKVVFRLFNFVICRTKVEILASTADRYTKQTVSRGIQLVVTYDIDHCEVTGHISMPLTQYYIDDRKIKSCTEMNRNYWQVSFNPFIRKRRRQRFYLLPCLSFSTASKNWRARDYSSSLAKSLSLAGTCLH